MVTDGSVSVSTWSHSGHTLFHVGRRSIAARHRRISSEHRGDLARTAPQTQRNDRTSVRVNDTQRLSLLENPRSSRTSSTGDLLSQSNQSRSREKRREQEEFHRIPLVVSTRRTGHSRAHWSVLSRPLPSHRRYLQTRRSKSNDRRRTTWP